MVEGSPSAAPDYDWRWVGASALAWLVGLSLAQGFARLLFWSDVAIQGRLEQATYIWARPIESLPGSTGYLLILGAAVGLAQGLQIQRIVDISWKLWTGATLLGFALFGFLGSISYNTQLSTVPGAPAGDGADQQLCIALLLVGLALAAAGLPQWLVLKRRLPRAKWWIVAGAVALYFGLPTAPGMSSLPGWVAMTLFRGALYGIATAIGLRALGRPLAEQAGDEEPEADGPDE